jgi:hypothetical protein
MAMMNRNLNLNDVDVLVQRRIDDALLKMGLAGRDIPYGDGSGQPGAVNSGTSGSGGNTGGVSANGERDFFSEGRFVQSCLAHCSHIARLADEYGLPRGSFDVRQCLTRTCRGVAGAA